MYSVITFLGATQQFFVTYIEVLYRLFDLGVSTQIFKVEHLSVDACFRVNSIRSFSTERTQQQIPRLPLAENMMNLNC